MLQNNTTAQNRVQTASVQELRELLKNVRTVGASAQPVLETLHPAACVVAALDNADCLEKLAGIAAVNPAGIAAGICAACKLTGAGRALLVLPEAYDDAAPAVCAAAEQLGLALETETDSLVDARAHQDDALVHLVTLAAMADALAGETPRAVICTEGGLREVPFGQPLRDAIPAADARAVVINHAFYPVSVLDEPLTPDFPLGSGAVELLGAGDCVVQSAAAQVELLRGKSCGKCTFCREGLYQLGGILNDMTRGRCGASDPELLRELTEAMPISTACSLGKRAAAPAASVLERFGQELEAHLRRKECPAGACKALLTIYVDPAVCQGNGDCIDVCPADCIEGRDGYISMIDEFECTKCGKCVEACSEGAVRYAQGRIPPLPERLTRVGRFRGR